MSSNSFKTIYTNARELPHYLDPQIDKDLECWSDDVTTTTQNKPTKEIT